MFQGDQAEIERYCRHSPRNVLSMLEFVQVSIRRHFYAVPHVLAAWDSGRASSALTARQVSALQEYHEKHEAVYSVLYACDMPLEYRFCYLLGLPGIGMAKAGFILQLALGKGGCLDTHNAALHRVDKRLLRVDGSNLLRTVREYLKLCNVLTSEVLWNSWCRLIATKYPNHFDSAEVVSKLHVTCIKRKAE